MAWILELHYGALVRAGRLLGPLAVLLLTSPARAQVCPADSADDGSGVCRRWEGGFDLERLGRGWVAGQLGERVLLCQSDCFELDLQSLQLVPMDPALDPSRSASSTCGVRGVDGFRLLREPISGSDLSLVRDDRTWQVARFDLASCSRIALGAPLETYELTGTMVASLPDGDLLLMGGFDIGPNTVASVHRFDSASQTWTTAAPLPEARTEGAAIRLDDGQVLVAGGTILEWVCYGDESCDGEAEDDGPRRTVWRYDPTLDSWSDAAPMLEPETGNGLTRLPDGTVLSTGAYAQRYDPRSNTWSLATDLALPPETVLADGSGGVILIGATAEQPSVSVGRLDLATGAVTYVDHLHHLAGDRAFVLPGGEVLWEPSSYCGGEEVVAQRTDPERRLVSAQVLGPEPGEPGCRASTALVGDGHLLRVVESSATLYDLAAGTHAALDVSGMDLAAHAAARLEDGSAMLLSANPGAPTPRLAPAWRLDRAGLVWVPLAPLPTPLGGVRLLPLRGQSVMAVGWSDPDAAAPWTTFVYDPAANAWHSTGGLPAAHAYDFTLGVTLTDGRVLITQPENTLVYDPATDGWQTFHTQPAVATPGSLVALPGGRVLSLGGETSSYTATAYVSMFDPSASTWRILPRMRFPHTRPAAALLPDGTVVATGNGEYGPGLVIERWSAVEAGAGEAPTPANPEGEAPLCRATTARGFHLRPAPTRERIGIEFDGSRILEVLAPGQCTRGQTLIYQVRDVDSGQSGWVFLQADELDATCPREHFEAMRAVSTPCP